MPSISSKSHDRENGETEALDEVGDEEASSWPSWLWAIAAAYWRPALLVLTPLAALPYAVSDLNRERCAFVMIVMSVYWILELLPLAATSLVPVVLCPVLGILSTNDVSMVYMKGSIMFIVGGAVLFQ